MPTADVSKLTGCALWPSRRTQFLRPGEKENSEVLRTGSARAEAAISGPPTPLRGCGATAFACQKLAGLPSRSSIADRAGPPPRLRRYGAASFAWLAEPKLTLRR